MMRNLDKATLDLAMKSLAIRLDQNLSDPVEIVVCGGSALILTGMIQHGIAGWIHRTTHIHDVRREIDRPFH